MEHITTKEHIKMQSARGVLRKLCALMLACALVLGSVPSSAYAATESSSQASGIEISVTVDYDAMWEVVDLVNAERAKEGLNPLTFNTDLLDVAILRAVEITLLFSHTRPDGTSCFTLRPSWAWTYGENIAMGYSSASAVMNGWMNSSGHRGNILTSSYTDIGVGCVIYNGTCYWVQFFAAGSGGSEVSRTTYTGTGTLTASINTKWSRLSGDDRYSTMASIVAETSALTTSTSTSVVLASGEKYPDALAASALAGYLDCSVVLTKGTTLAGETIAALESTNAKHVYIMGGTSTISAAVEAAIEALGYTTERVAGDSRVETAVEIWNEASDLGLTSDTCIIAKGSSYADALSIASYAYAAETPIFLLDDNSSLTDSTVQAIKAGGFTQVIVLGADTSISDSELASKLPGLTVLRLGGDDRYETSELIVQWSTGEMTAAAFQPSVTLSYDGIGIANGGNFPDALAAAALLGTTKSPLLLVPGSSTSVSTATRQRIERVIGEHASVITSGWVFGGSSSVSDAVYRLLVQESFPTT